MKLIAAALGSLLATGAFAQTMPMEAEIAPGTGIPALGIESASAPVLALLTPADDPLAYTDLLDVGSVGAPGIVAFGLEGMSDADIATGTLAPTKR